MHGSVHCVTLGGARLSVTYANYSNNSGASLEKLTFVLHLNWAFDKTLIDNSFLKTTQIIFPL